MKNKVLPIQIFNTRLVAWIRSSLLLKICINGENVITYLNIDVVLFGTYSHMFIKIRKVDPCAEGGDKDIN